VLSIAHLFAAIVATTLAEAGLALDALPVWTGLLWAFAPWPLVRWIRGADPRRRVVRLAARAVSLWPVLAQVLAVGVSGWLVVGAHTAPGLAGASVLSWPGPGLFAVLAPFVLAELATVDAVTTGGRLLRAGGSRERWVATVHALRSLAAVLLPLALYALVTTPLRRDPQLRAWIDGALWSDLVWTLCVALVLAAALPSLFALALGLRPLEGDRPEHARLLEVYRGVAERLGFRGRAPRLWPTGGREINAAVVGFVPWHRFVVVTDGLARGLEPAQARALFGHEMGHAVRRHPALFATYSIAVLLPALLVPEWLGGQASELALWAGPVVLAVLWYLGFGWLSRRAELEADLVAQRSAGGPEPLIDLLARTVPRRRWHTGGWRHFSPARRAVFARAAARHLEVGLRLERSLERARTAARLGAAAAVVAAVATGWTLGATTTAPGDGDGPAPGVQEPAPGAEEAPRADPEGFEAGDPASGVDAGAIAPNDSGRRA